MIPLSVLDLVPVREGHDATTALADSGRAAARADELGYKRYWVAEHHAIEGVAGAAVSVVLSHLGRHTRSIRLGAGGIMLPNHNPYVIAEQFGTLDALYPGRIDLGLGRAPGADGRIAQALRKDLYRAAENFPHDVIDLQALLAGNPQLPLQAYPGKGAAVDLWILGSSLFGAQLAAALGLPYAFASHFAPQLLDQALATYRDRFQPSEHLDKPHAMAAINVVTADNDEEAVLLASSMDQSFVALRTGNPGSLKPPVEGYRESLPDTARGMLEQTRSVSAAGSVETVRKGLATFIERTGADELIVVGAIYDQAARLRSLELTMTAAKGL